MKSSRHFEQGGEAYARFRPDYPPQLVSSIVQYVDDRAMALDVGCGNGQLSCLLAHHFDRVYAIDASVSQIEQARPHPRVHYSVESAEAISLSKGCVSLVTVAQAAHWFDLEAFYEEVERVTVQNGLIALITYGILEIAGPVKERFRRFCLQDMGPFWPPERRHVETAYADLAFPFEEVNIPIHRIDQTWTLSDLTGYIETWSASKQARDAGRNDVIDRFHEDVRLLWSDPARPRSVSWPLTVRLGRV